MRCPKKVNDPLSVRSWECKVSIGGPLRAVGTRLAHRPPDTPILGDRIGRRGPLRPYSTDLREQLWTAIARGQQSLRPIAQLFSVSLSFRVRWQQRYRHTGSVQPKPHGGGPVPCLDERAVQRLLDWVREQP